MNTNAFIGVVGAGGVVLGALVSVIGNLVAARWSYRTVNRQLEAASAQFQQERADVAAMEEAKAARQVQAFHRQSRLGAHVDALESLEALVREVRFFGYSLLSLVREDDEGVPDIPALPEHDDQVFKRAGENVERVGFLASDSVARDCETALRAVVTAENLLMEVWRPRADRLNSAGFEQSLEAASEAIAVYRASARREVGTNA